MTGERGGEGEVLSAELTEGALEVSSDVLGGALEANREGRRAGACRIADELEVFLGELSAELEAAFSAAEPEMVEPMFEGATPSPLVAAHFGGAGDVHERVRHRLNALRAKRGA